MTHELIWDNPKYADEYPRVLVGDGMVGVSAPLRVVGNTPAAFLDRYADGYCTNGEPGKVDVTWWLYETAEQFAADEPAQQGEQKIQPRCQCGVCQALAGSIADEIGKGGRVR